MIIVSACLAGVNCRYDGTSCVDEKVEELVAGKYAIPVCPEQLGGLCTPRSPAEIFDGEVVTRCGNVVTEQFYRGAKEACNIAKLVKSDRAILKANSPACGYGKIYDGTFSGKLVDGKGIFAQKLEDMGVKIRVV